MRLNNILVCLDLSSTDKALVDYTVFLKNISAPNGKITLFHNIRYDFISGFLTFDNDTIEKLKATIAREISQNYLPLFSDSQQVVEVMVHDDNSTETAILACKEKQKADLILMGMKDDRNGSGVIPQKILSADPDRTPVILVPEGKTPRLDQLIAAIDVTASSRKVMDTAIALGQLSGGITTCLHVYKIPLNYFPFIEMSNSDMKDEIRRKAAKKLIEYMQNPNIGEDFQPNLRTLEGSNIAEKLHEFATSIPSDLMILERISKKNILSNRVGGTTRKLLTLPGETPLMIL